MRKPAVILATALSTVALAGVVGIGVASADPTPSPTPSASAAPTSAPSTQTQAQTGKPGKVAKGDKARARDLTRRALHGEVTLGAKKPHVVDFQRGEVTAVSATSITVKSADGFSATYVVDAKTVVRHLKAKAVIADVETGDKVRVVAAKDGSTVTAKRIADQTK